MARAADWSPGLARLDGVSLRTTYALPRPPARRLSVSLLLRATDQSWTWLDGWLVCGIELDRQRAVHRQGRRPTRPTCCPFLGFSLLSWSLGDVVLTIESLGGATPPSPVPQTSSTFCSTACLRGRDAVHPGAVKKITSPNWLDGAIAGLVRGRVCRLRLPQHPAVGGGSTLATVTNLAYPIGDVLLLGLVVAGFAVLSRRSKAPWFLCKRDGVERPGDTSNLFQNSLERRGSVHPECHRMADRHRGDVHGRSGCAGAPDPLAPQTVRRGSPSPISVRLPHWPSSWSPACTPSAVWPSAWPRPRWWSSGSGWCFRCVGSSTLSQERHRQSVTDDLTDLKNRRYLFRVLDDFFASTPTGPDQRSLAFLFVDLNRFKEINDSFGHPAGDELLRQLGARLSGSLRDTDLLVRSEETSSRSCSSTETPPMPLRSPNGSLPVWPSRSCSTSSEPHLRQHRNRGSAHRCHGQRRPGLVRRRGHVPLQAGHTPLRSYEQTSTRRSTMRLLEELRAAIDEGELVLHYQPQFDLRSGEILAVEALVRWIHPRPWACSRRPSSSPWPRKRVLCRITSGYSDRHRPVRDVASSRTLLIVSVNISPTNLLEPGSSTWSRDQLELHGFPAERWSSRSPRPA